MNDFALFSWWPNEAAGGFDDFVMRGTLEECKRAYELIYQEQGSDPEAHIVDLQTMKIIFETDFKYLRSPLVGGEDKRWYEWISRK
jgi:hypothetical protein